jgi:hypothetical protein
MQARKLPSAKKEESSQTDSRQAAFTARGLRGSEGDAMDEIIRDLG